MPTFQLKRRETVKVLRTYEVEATHEAAAMQALERWDAECVDEMAVDTIDWESRVEVTSIDGMQPDWWWRLHGEESDDAGA